MEKIRLQHPEAADDRRNVMLMQKTSFTAAPERKVDGTAMMMQTHQTW
jgi:hypothetical protein